MYQIYQIEANDSLASIAQKYNTTIDEIRRLNGMAMNYMLTPGNYIVIPNNNTGFYRIYTVQKGDNLYQIANQHGTTVSNLVLINGLNESDYIYPGQQILIPNDGVSVYMTKEETLRDVATKTGISQEELIKQNESIYLLPDQMIIYKKRENM